MTVVNAPWSELVTILACPACRTPLAGDAQRLTCDGCARTFGFDGPVPVLTARDPTRSRLSVARRLHESVVGNPRLYDIVQALLGGHEIAGRVSEALRNVGSGATLLDIGAGTGMLAELIPPGSSYLWLDTDPLKLRGFLARSIPSNAVVGDAVRLPFVDRAVSWAALIAVSHHLPDAALQSCLRETARVTRDRFIFVDALRGHRARSRLLWQLDRGCFPRTEDELLRAISTQFDVVEVTHFSKLHEYLLCMGVPRVSSASGPAV